MYRLVALAFGLFLSLSLLHPDGSMAAAPNALVRGSIEALLPGLTAKAAACPAGQNRDPQSGVCFSCSHNDHFENGRCVPCKPGFHEEVQADDNGEEQRVCVPDRGKKKKTKAKSKTKPTKAKACAKGLEFRDGKCRTKFPEVEDCPAGQNPDPVTGVCFSCSHNDHFENGRCVPCKKGFHVEGDACVAD